MKITFIVPGIPERATGGVKVIMEYANRLVENYPGVDVTLCFWGHLGYNMSRKRHILFFIKNCLNLFRIKFQPNWFSLNKKIYKRYISNITDASVPDGDWVFATAALTAEGVKNLSSSKGRKAYLIQDYETWDMKSDEIDKTFRFGMLNITVSHWLENLVNKAASGSCICIPNPVDTSVFYPDSKFKRQRHTVAVLYHEGAHKGFSFAWKAIEKAREAIPDLQVNMFGTFAKPDGLPDWVSYTRNASAEQLLRIYNESEIYVCASVNEGYALTCVEAMACGCALIVTDFEGSKEYAVNGENSIVVPVGDVNGIASNIVRVVEDPRLRDEIGNAGIRSTQSLDWKTATCEMANALGIKDIK
ncbi:glycosyltransferase family 4 protein [Bifidobacterium moukalabense]|uniref:glycosyltransferase family 4 protein n=1 Tax=Bifidobacterium moukalabense TaxID=1333651 RepID=UPI0010F5592B|nr:glycosyltransferase family 4 protein [Bifidobacterium moukalabense]